MILDDVNGMGEVHILLTDKDGNVLLDRTDKNMVMDVGLGFISSRMIDATSAVMSHMAIGTGTNNSLGNMTALQTEVARQALSSSSRVTTTVSNDSVQYIANFPKGIGTGALTEAGLFNAAGGGLMLARLKFDVVTKGSEDGLTLTWKVRFSNAA